jgi:hypothetical protein
MHAQNVGCVYGYMIALADPMLRLADTTMSLHRRSLCYGNFPSDRSAGSVDKGSPGVPAWTEDHG